jgi:hypothetical protein
VSPNPLAADGAVVLDLDARTATVVPAETGYPAMLWRHGYEKLVRAGYGGPTVWAHSSGRRDIARGHPEGGALRFTFAKGDPTWAELVGTPALSAVVVVDRTSEQILNVKFRGRRAV